MVSAYQHQPASLQRGWPGEKRFEGVITSWFAAAQQAAEASLITMRWLQSQAETREDTAGQTKKRWMVKVVDEDEYPWKHPA
jgi:hypothetical protein